MLYLYPYTTYTHTYIPIPIQHIHTYLYPYLYNILYTHIYIHTYTRIRHIHIYIHTYTRIHTYIHTYLYPCIRHTLHTPRPAISPTRVAGYVVKRIHIGNVIAAVYVDGFDEANGNPRPQHDHVIGQQQQTPKETHAEYCGMKVNFRSLCSGKYKS